jgi:hypothetical protein
MESEVIEEQVLVPFVFGVIYIHNEVDNPRNLVF